MPDQPRPTPDGAYGPTPATVFEAFCAAGLWPGLGRTTASRLPAAGIRTPADVGVAQLSAVDGVAPGRARRLVGTFAEAAGSYRVVELLVGADLPARLARGLVAEFGQAAADELRSDPWSLLIPAEAELAQADRLARSFGATRVDPRRGPAVLAHLLARAAGRAGDTASPVADLVRAAARDGVADPAAALASACEDGRVIIFGELAALDRYAMAEQAVADGMARLVATAEPLRPGTGHGVARPAAGSPAPVSLSAAGSAEPATPGAARIQAAMFGDSFDDDSGDDDNGDNGDDKDDVEVGVAGAGDAGGVRGRTGDAADGRAGGTRDSPAGGRDATPGASDTDAGYDNDDSRTGSDGDDGEGDGADPLEGLDETQVRAALAALQVGVSILTGGPGTGKSRTVAAVVRLAERAGARVALAAPTGRAAKRLEELSGWPACTLHRLLQAQGRSGTFARNELEPVEADLIVVDETSMLDAELAAALLDACADGTHLMFVGDPAQLPSIGPGRVLADLLESGVVPVTELSRLYRQAEGGAIATLAAAVRGGELPPPPRGSGSGEREVVVVPCRSSGEAAHRTVQLVTDSIPRALGIGVTDIQVVTPVHGGDAGTGALNAALKRVLNPGDGEVYGFDVGDRVVATANHLDAGFANGEIGVVTALGAKGGLTVAFPVGEVEVPASGVADLRHGWAVTVHRAQGSEWPAVVAVFPPEAGRMLSRPLVYTAMTRAARHLSVVPVNGPALRQAVRQAGGRRRRTVLPSLLAGDVDEGGGVGGGGADDPGGLRAPQAERVGAPR